MYSRNSSKPATMAGQLIATYVFLCGGWPLADQLVHCQGPHSFLLVLDAQTFSCSVIAQLIVCVHECTSL